MKRRTPRSTITDTRFPYTSLFRSEVRPNNPARLPAAPPARKCSKWERQRLQSVLPKPFRGIRNSPVATRTLTILHSAPPSIRAACSIPACWVRWSMCHRIALLFRRSEEHTSELQSLMRISYAVFCLKKKNSFYTLLFFLITIVSLYLLFFYLFFF